MIMEFKVKRLAREGAGNFTEIGTITYQGADFTAQGTTITDTHGTVYITSDKRRGDVTTWGGEVIGRYEETGKWKRRHPRTGYPYTIRTVRVILADGRTYTGRYGPDGCQAVRIKRVKRELTNA